MDAARWTWNVVDVEATCWPEQAPPGMVSEIIEIGIAVVDLAGLPSPRADGHGARGERVARHRILVRPERSTVSAFCTELTGLTQAEVDTGVSFAAACRILARDHAAGARPWASWGDYDRKQFTRQCQATNTPYPFGARHVNAKAEFARVYGLAKRPGMAQALEIAGLPLEGRHHSGVDDAWNIAALILAMTNQGAGAAFAHSRV
jgi:inhibitor of KinA sporulation pathway (predicted exonuclease)